MEGLRRKYFWEHLAQSIHSQIVWHQTVQLDVSTTNVTPLTYEYKMTRVMTQLSTSIKLSGDISSRFRPIATSSRRRSIRKRNLFLRAVRFIDSCHTAGAYSAQVTDIANGPDFGVRAAVASVLRRPFYRRFQLTVSLVFFIVFICQRVICKNIFYINVFIIGYVNWSWSLNRNYTFNKQYGRQITLLLTILNRAGDTPYGRGLYVSFKA